MIAPSVTLGEGVVIHHPDLVNLYGCTIGAGSRIGTFVEIQKNAAIGRDCKISSHTFICEGVTIEDGVFVGHGVMFTNDMHPRAVNPDGSLQTDSDWELLPTRVGRRASIGSNATILPGLTIGEGAQVGAGAVVTPTLFVHGESDLRVPIEQGEQMYTALRKRRVPAMFIRYPESYHTGWSPWNTVHRYHYEMEWWKQYLATAPGTSQ